MVPAVVETDTVTGVAVAPFKVAELGLTVHVESCGAPLHTRETVWFSPPCGAMDIE